MSFRALPLVAVLLLLLGAVAPIAGATPVEAKSRGGHVYGFRTGTCKTSSCRAKHPSGRYVHPLTHRRH